MANGTTKITRTFGTPTDRDKWTLSMWLKLSQIQEQGIFHAHIDANNYFNLEFGTNGQLTLYDKLASATSALMVTDRLFRDFSAWYHLVISWDSGNATPGERVIFWVNGVRETDFSTETYPAQDADSAVNGANLHEIGAKLGSYDFAGDMSWVQFVDGSVLTPTSFGSTDATSGIWKIKPSAYGTPGNNGFTLAMQDRSNLDLDTSSNAATFATTGTLTATYDNPSNNFCMANNLSKGSTIVLSNGNTTIAKDSGWLSCMGTFGMDASKWYWEQKVVAVGNANAGITMSKQDGTSHSAVDDTRIMYGSDGNAYNGQGSTTATGTTFTTGDIISVALDCAGDTVKFYKNDVLIHTETESVISDNQWSPAWGMSSGTWDTNFGNGYFGTTAVASANADDAGIGAFEYAPPTGYYALCTKNIKAYGG
jgi:hypothetical protein